MSIWTASVAIVVLLVVLALCYLLILAGRRLWLNCSSNLFDCAVRENLAQSPWKVGLATYQGDRLCWYPIWSFSWQPHVVIDRRIARLISHRDLTAEELEICFDDDKVTLLRQKRGENVHEFELALNEGAAWGLQCWLEAAPPGRVGYRRSFGEEKF